MSESTMTREQQIEKLGELIKDVRIAMLTTVLPDGSLRSRPMATQNEKFDGTLWFFTSDESGKVHEIEDDQHVNVAFADAESQTYISISGKARLSRDRAKIEALWNPFVQAWFPKGKDDPDLALLQIEVASAEYWDAPSSKMVNLLGMAKAVVTGKQYDAGENEKLNL